MGNKLVWRPSTDDSHPKPNERKRKLENHSGMRNIRACSVAPCHCLSHSDRCCERRRASDHFENLPENLLSIILSKLPLNEVFQGFPNLRKLDLHMVHASGNTTKIKLYAVNLTTFVYKGPMVTIDLNKTSELENVNISFNRVTLEHVIYALPYELSNTQRLTLRAFFDLPKMPYLIENRGKFSQMKHLQLQFACPEDVNISLVSILKAAPSMEKLEMHFSVLAYFYDGVEPLMRLPKCTYRHLKDAYITGFVASKDQLEFLEHVAENAPALEVLTVDTRDFVVVKDPWEESHSKEKAQFLAAVRGTARSHVEGKIPPTCCMRIH
ncbi:hypothetical protein PR202_gb06978 [Eleusine coracana subsp. coracana]|uniref:At1g61320/AtMIF1 LRR domain-containing protein n=1 Tax=Eleusine coracana subsp. coracana TaxID=191504 RepID=A0AAV5E8J4_ELECO|nr:hypothetical protein PR202_gb06978 [Eleusine coracana subsp. coracana]